MTACHDCCEFSDATASSANDTAASQPTERRLDRRRHDTHDLDVGVRAAPPEELQIRHCTGKSPHNISDFDFNIVPHISLV